MRTIFEKFYDRGPSERNFCGPTGYFFLPYQFTNPTHLDLDKYSYKNIRIFEYWAWTNIFIFVFEHTDFVVSFESFRALKLSKSESFRALIFSQHSFNFRALKLSRFESFRAVKISKYERYRTLRVTLFEIIRALRFSINSITRFIFKL